MLKYFALLALIIMAAACNQKPTELPPPVKIASHDSVRSDFKKYYDAYKVDGCFVLFNVGKSSYIYYNKEDATVATSPASTFKIPNSMIGLETGVIKDENYVMKWDGVKRWNENWNQDTDLKMAYKNSTVWYYQELARRVGQQRIKEWVEKFNYGNMKTSGKVDEFWLNDTLKISPIQQIDFLTRLAQNKLPLAKRTVDITKNIMVAKDTTNFLLRAKTGWGAVGKKDMGWYVGYIEAGKDTFVFANRIQTADTTNEDFGKARIDICYSIFKDLGIYKQ
jgi:beta-lactamase class D